MRLSFCSVIIPQYQNIPVVIDDSLSLKKFLPKISSETFNSRVACSPAVLYWSWWITAWFTVCVSRNTASKPQTALWGAPYGAFFLAIFTEEEWVLIEKGLLDISSNPFIEHFDSNCHIWIPRLFASACESPCRDQYPRIAFGTPKSKRSAPK